MAPDSLGTKDPLPALLKPFSALLTYGLTVRKHMTGGSSALVAIPIASKRPVTPAFVQLMLVVSSNKIYN